MTLFTENKCTIQGHTAVGGRAQGSNLGPLIDSNPVLAPQPALEGTCNPGVCYEETWVWEEKS